MLHARRYEFPGVGMAHRVRAREQPFLCRELGRVGSSDARSKLFPRRSDDQRVHEAVHHERDRTHPATKGPNTAGAGNKTPRPRQRDHREPRLCEYETRRTDRVDQPVRFGEESAGHRREERVTGNSIGWVVLLENRHVALAHVRAPGDPVAAQVPELQHLVGKRSTGARLDRRPHVVIGDGPKAVTPALVVADVRGRFGTRTSATPANGSP